MAKAYLALVVLLALSASIHAHEEKPKASKPHKHAPITVWGVIKGHKDFKILAKAVKVAGLVGPLSKQNFTGTVFAPTDKAFFALFKQVRTTPEKALKDKSLVGLLLKYHVSTEVVRTKAIPRLPKTKILPTLLGPKLAAFKSWWWVTVKAVGSKATIVRADIKASKAVVHAVDTVLLPKKLAADPKAKPAPKAKTPASPSPKAAATSSPKKADKPGDTRRVTKAPIKKKCLSVAQIAVKANLTRLVQAVKIANLTHVISNTNFNGTVFAPTNRAFRKLQATIKGPIDPTRVASVVKYHITRRYLLKAQLRKMSGKRIPTLLPKKFLKTRTVWGRTLIKGQVTSARIVVANIKACKAVVHIVDHVLLPKLK